MDLNKYTLYHNVHKNQQANGIEQQPELRDEQKNIWSKGVIKKKNYLTRKIYFCRL